jgi:hypothetical protein
MHRAALPAMGILGVAGVAGVAAADPWTVRMESGAEADSNVTRTEGPTVAAAVGRLGARIDYHDALLGGAYAVQVSSLARMIVSSQNKDESVMLDGGELRWMHPISGASLAAGVHLTAADSFGVLVPTGARTYRNLGGDALLMLGHSEDHHLMLGVGWRDFVYKQVTAFDWRGPIASARLDSMLWHAPDRTRSLELTAVLGFEARSYNDVAQFNGAPDGSGNSFATNSTLRRRDRYQRGGLELTWTGDVFATGSYQVTVVDSNSYGQSLIRQRITAAATMEVMTALFVSATATLQIDQYPEGVPVSDLLHQELTSLEDENRSSLQVLITRALSTAWSLEVRGAIWRDFGTTGASFGRELAYAGVLYQH